MPPVFCPEERQVAALRIATELTHDLGIYLLRNVKCSCSGDTHQQILAHLGNQQKPGPISRLLRLDIAHRYPTYAEMLRWIWMLAPILLQTAKSAERTVLPRPP